MLVISGVLIYLFIYILISCLHMLLSLLHAEDVSNDYSGATKVYRQATD